MVFLDRLGFLPVSTLSMRNVDDPTVPDNIPEIAPEAYDAPALEERGDRAKRGDLRGGTGAAGPLFKLPGEE